MTEQDKLAASKKKLKKKACNKKITGFIPVFFLTFFFRQQRFRLRPRQIKSFQTGYIFTRVFFIHRLLLYSFQASFLWFIFFNLKMKYCYFKNSLVFSFQDIKHRNPCSV